MVSKSAAAAPAEVAGRGRFNLPQSDSSATLVPECTRRSMFSTTVFKAASPFWSLVTISLADSRMAAISGDAREQSPDRV